MIFEWDDFGANHVISQQCQSHDCRAKLDELHAVNPQFKATLFAIPGEMTTELLDWCAANKGWIELAVHGLFHSSNYECEKLTKEEFHEQISRFGFIEEYFVKGFRAPGWQISDGVYEWLKESGWWVADQSYNNGRRPKELRAWVNYDGEFAVHDGRPSYNDRYPYEAYHGHTWDVGWNGIYEDWENVKAKVVAATEFKFVSEVM